MSTKSEEENSRYRVVVFLNTDPRIETLDYVNLSPEIMGADIVAYVAPYPLLKHNIQDKYFRRIPLISWEEPNTDKLRAEYYLFLYKEFRIEVAINLDWPYRVPGASEAGIVPVDPWLARSLKGDQLSRLLHLRMHGRVSKQSKKYKKGLVEDD